MTAQAWRIEPTSLSDALITQFTGIDGALLFDGKGVCHAIGVIVDGPAGKKGSLSRGSRYNNAIRYQNSDAPPSVIVAVSSDGTIDVMPDIPRRIERRLAEAALVEVERYAAVELTDENWADMHRAFDYVRSLSFYLDTEQCNRVNAAFRSFEQAQRKARSFVLPQPSLRPNPEMNDSYFL